MVKLSEEVFKKAEHFIMTQGRELEKARFNYFFRNGSSMAVVDALKPYQNEDGGFGHGIEPDFTMLDSSPMATTIGFEIIGEIKGENADELIRRGVQYLEHSYNSERNGWFAVPAKVNDYPHAPWWNYNPEEKMTVIDYSWGNPSAEIIGYLYIYRTYVRELDLDALIQYACDNLLNKDNFPSEHEIYCFIRMYNLLPAEKQTLLVAQLTSAVRSLVQTGPEAWKQYTPQPVHFIQQPQKPSFGITKEAIDTNLDYLIENLNKQGAILPNWEWGQYPEAWAKAKMHWTGIMTLRTLKILSNFGRITD